MLKAPKLTKNIKHIWAPTEYLLLEIENPSRDLWINTIKSIFSLSLNEANSLLERQALGPIHFFIWDTVIYNIVRNNF